MATMQRPDYAPTTPRDAVLEPDEPHLHSFRLRGYRYGPLLGEPEREPLPDAGGGPGDERAFAAKVKAGRLGEVHAYSPFFVVRAGG